MDQFIPVGAGQTLKVNGPPSDLATPSLEDDANFTMDHVLGIDAGYRRLGYASYNCITDKIDNLGVLDCIGNDKNGKPIKIPTPDTGHAHLVQMFALRWQSKETPACMHDSSKYARVYFEGQHESTDAVRAIEGALTFYYSPHVVSLEPRSTKALWGIVGDKSPKLKTQAACLKYLDKTALAQFQALPAVNGREHAADAVIIVVTGIMKDPQFYQFIKDQAVKRVKALEKKKEMAAALNQP